MLRSKAIQSQRQNMDFNYKKCDACIQDVSKVFEKHEVSGHDLFYISTEFLALAMCSLKLPQSICDANLIHTLRHRVEQLAKDFNIELIKDK